MIRRTIGFGLVVLLIAALVACSEEDPTPNGDPPILGGFESLPKQLATIALTPTPSPVMAAVEGQPVEVVAQEQPTQGPPRPTPTLTPYVGLFLGEPTVEGGEPAPTLAAYVINPGGGGPALPGSSGASASGSIPAASNGPCGGAPVAGVFGQAYNGVQQRLGCPLNSGASIYGMAAQPFERGTMIWRGDSHQIYALAASGQFWQVPDTWTEGQPADDPAFAPPAGVLQPVRGFGLVWRSNPAIRDALGWATQPEAAFDGYWQEFERGALLLGSNRSIYAIFTGEGQFAGPLSP